MPNFDAYGIYLEGKQQREEIDRFLNKYGDRFLGLSSLKELSGMLEFVNYVFFSLIAWIGFAWLTPIVNSDHRPSWLMWLILGPLFGFTFGGFGALLVWLVFAHSFG